jgi:predicted TIM-barrel fold metal-dependent hydrolase
VPIIDCYTLLGPWPHAEADLSLEALAAGMQARAVSHSLVTHATAIFHDPAVGNDQVIQLGAQHAQIVPVAVINPLRYPDCLEEISRCLGRGVKVFRLCPREHGYPFSGAVGPLAEVLEQLGQARLLLADLVGLPAPVLTADVARLLAGPTAVTVEGDALGQVIQSARKSPHLWVETSRLQAGGAVEAAVKHLGAERVVFGSGAPLRALGSAVMSVQYADLSDGDRNAIFDGNAGRALG